MKSASEDQRCRLCGARAPLPLYSKPYGLIVGCRQCGVLLLNPPQGADSAWRAQQETFASDWIQSRLRQQDIIYRDARRRLQEIRRYLCGGRLLEIGCGTGELLALAVQEGFEVTGVDSSQQSLQQVRARFGLRQLYDSLDAVPRSAGYFDVVVISHVLEHLYDPVRALRRIYSLLRPQGLLFVAVPNLGGWGARLLGGDWPGFGPVHVTYFTFQTLSNLLARTGFSVVARSRYGPPTIALSLLNFAKFKMLGRREPLPDVAPGAHLGAPERLTMKALHLSARLAVVLLSVLLYPVGLLQVRQGRTEELAMLARRGAD